MRLLVLVLVGVAVVVALKVVGILLVSALLVLPGATARPLAAAGRPSSRARSTVALVSVVGGLLLSVAVDVAPGAAIILVGAAIFVAALLLGRARRT